MLRMCILLGLIYTTSYAYGNCSISRISRLINEAKPIDPTCAISIAKTIQGQGTGNKMLYNFSTEIRRSPAEVELKSEYFHFLFDIVKNVNGSDSMGSVLQYDYAKWLFGVKEDYDSGGEEFLKAYLVRQNTKIGIDSIFMAGCLSNAGICYYYAGDHEKANHYIRQVVDQNWPVSPKTRANNYQILAEINKLNGNIALATEYYFLSANKLMDIKKDSISLAIYGFNPIGVLYYDFANYERALSYHIKAQDILKRSDTTSNLVQKALMDVQSNIANCLTRLERHDESLIISKDLLQSYAHRNNSYGYIRTALNLFNSLIKQSKTSEAEAVYKEIDSLLVENPNNVIRQAMIDNKAQLYRIQGAYSKARQIRIMQLKKCCDLSMDDIFSQEIDEIGNEKLIELYEVLIAVGALYSDEYAKDTLSHSAYIDSAFHIYQQASTILDQIKLGLFDPDFSADLGALNTDLLEEVLDLVVNEPTWLNRIYPFFEKAKSASLLASIQSAVIESHFENKFPEIKESRVIQQEINRLEHENSDQVLLNSKSDSFGQILLDLKEKLININRKKHNVLKTGNAINELYGHEELIALQRRIKDESAVVSYFTTSKLVYILVVQKDHIKLLSNPKHQTFDADMISLISMNSLELNNTSDWISANSRLSKVLWTDEMNKLPNEIVILPDGVLNYLPFEILFSHEASNSHAWKALPYLIKTKTISYNFSASIWNEMSTKESTSGGLLTMAPEFTIDLQASNDDRQVTVPLVFAEKEVEDIRSICENADHLIPANKTEFIADASHASVVHFAGHAILNDDVAENSYLAFSSNDEMEDKLLIREIYNIKSPSNLVVLSACNTGQGEFKKGEGVMSLARAFAYAGAKSMVYSLWEVNDGSTRKIMKRFYLELKNGSSKNEALRQAKLAYLNEAVGKTQHPFFWASFVAMGDMSPIVRNSIPGWLFILIFLLVCFGITWYRKSKLVRSNQV